MGPVVRLGVLEKRKILVPALGRLPGSLMTEQIELPPNQPPYKSYVRSYVRVTVSELWSSGM
jgi:hypothetical protein